MLKPSNCLFAPLSRCQALGELTVAKGMTSADAPDTAPLEQCSWLLLGLQLRVIPDGQPRAPGQHPLQLPAAQSSFPQGSYISKSSICLCEGTQQA